MASAKSGYTQAPLDEPLILPTPSAPSAPPIAHVIEREGDPWAVPVASVYSPSTPITAVHVPLDLARESESLPEGRNDASWKAHREATLREWGRLRERQLHRFPSCLMDQLQSGSGLFPVRLLGEVGASFG